MSADLVHAVDELDAALDVLTTVHLALAASPDDEELIRVRCAMFEGAIVRVRNAKTFLEVARAVTP